MNIFFSSQCCIVCHKFSSVNQSFFCQHCISSGMDDYYIMKFSLDVLKYCKNCGEEYIAKKPWYCWCSSCHNKDIDKPVNYNRCRLCKVIALKQKDHIILYSGTTQHTHQDRYYELYRTIFSKKVESQISIGKFFGGQVCINHLINIPNDYIIPLSLKKVICFMKNTSLPRLFRIKCFVMSLMLKKDPVECYSHVLNWVDKSFIILRILHIPQELLEYILLILISLMNISYTIIPSKINMILKYSKVNNYLNI